MQNRSSINRMIRKIGVIAVALAALALWLGAAPALAVPPGTPTVFATGISQPNGIAATQSHIFVSTPWCTTTPYDAASPPAWNIDSLDATGTPTPFATIPEPYDASALVGDIAYTTGVDPSGTPATNCVELALRISPSSAFGAGTLYAAFGGHIYKIDSGGAVTLFTDIPSLDVTNPHSSMAFDTGGAFGGDMIVVGTNAGTGPTPGPEVPPFAEIWKVDSTGTPTLLATISGADSGCNSGNAFNGCIEGADIVGNAAGLSTYAGQLVTSLGRNSKLAMVDGSGTVTLLNNNLFGTADYTGEEVINIPSNLCTAKPNGVDTGLSFFDVNFDQYNEPNAIPGLTAPPNSACTTRPDGNSVIGYPAANFSGLGGQLVQNPEANGISDSGYLVTTGSANATDATDTVFDDSCYETESMTFVTCIQCSTNTLTWGYWKEHTGSFRARQDATYLSLSSTCPAVNGVGALSLDGDCDNASDSFMPTVITCAKKSDCGTQSADYLFAGGNTGRQPTCNSGNCVSLFAAQLAAAELNGLKDGGGLSSAVYNNPLNPSDPFNGESVGDILNAMVSAFDTYVDGGAISCGGVTGSFKVCQATLNAINTNTDSASGVLSCP
jgi:hypothetical protein